MSIEDVVNFYDFTFTSDEVKNMLIKSSPSDFARDATAIAKKNGFDFTEDEMIETMKGLLGCNSNEPVDFGDEWINKIMSVGWVPKGYSRQ